LGKKRFAPPVFTVLARQPNDEGIFKPLTEILKTNDPERGILVGAVNRFATIVQLYPREQEKEILPTMETGSVRLEAEVAPMLDTP
jgi:hypothetical protein